MFAMFAPVFGAIFIMVVLTVCSILFAITCGVLYLLRWGKAGRLFAILASTSVILLLVSLYFWTQ
jgi:hypothetical protein